MRSHGDITSLLYPCDHIDAPANCFLWLFATFDGYFKPGLQYEPPALSRLPAFTNLEYPFWQVCTRHRMLSVAHNNACVWGMTATSFIYYHEAALSVRQSPLSSYDACMHVPFSFSLSAPMRQCALLFGNKQWAPSLPVAANNTLIQWCKLVCNTSATKWRENQYDVKSWLACAAGAFSGSYWTLRSVAYALVQGVCETLLEVPWQHPSTRQAATRACQSTVRDAYGFVDKSFMESSFHLTVLSDIYV